VPDFLTTSRTLELITAVCLNNGELLLALENTSNLLLSQSTPSSFLPPFKRPSNLFPLVRRHQRQKFTAVLKMSSIQTISTYTLGEHFSGEPASDVSTPARTNGDPRTSLILALCTCVRGSLECRRWSAERLAHHMCIIRRSIRGSLWRIITGVAWWGTELSASRQNSRRLHVAEERGSIIISAHA
jgi:hypothetical protein